MARALIAATTAVTNSVAAQSEVVRAGGLTGTDGLYIAAAVDVDEKMCMYIRETANGATGTVWVKKGANVASGIGDLAITVGGSASLIVGPLERARFGQSDGTINIDVGGVTGIFAAIDLSC